MQWRRYIREMEWNFWSAGISSGWVMSCNTSLVLSSGMRLLAIFKLSGFKSTRVTSASFGKSALSRKKPEPTPISR